jgi:hypothetical protein
MYTTLLLALPVYARMFLVFWCMVLWLLHYKDSGGILVDCNTQILVVFWW